MRMLILNCDYDPSNETNGAMLLKKYISSFDIKNILIKNIHSGEFPSEDEIAYSDGIIITGSRASVYDKEEWISKLMDLVKLIDKLEIPTLGICFGFQVVAESLGGNVGPSGSFEEGFGSIFLNEEGLENPIFDRFFNEIKVYQSHGDVAKALPKGSVILAENDHSLQAYCIRNFFCVQFHPEILPEIAELMGKRDGKDLDKVFNGVDKKYDQTLKIIENFIDYCRK